MKSKMRWAALGAGLVLTAWICVLSVRIFSAKEAAAQVSNDPMALLSDKIDKLELSLDKRDKELNKKLDQILNNQEEILKQLSIVKVRASVGR